MSLIFVNPFKKNNNYKSFNQRIQPFQSFAFIISASIHLAFAFLFMHTGIKELMYFNFFISLPLLIGGYILSLLNKNALAWFIFYFEVGVHAVIAVYFIGWESGFQYYLLSCSLLVHLAYKWNQWLRWFVFVLYILLYITAFYNFRDTSIYQIDKVYYNLLYIFNILSFTFSGSIFVYFFINLVAGYEEILIRSNTRLNQKNKLITDQKDEIETQRDCLGKQKEQIEEMLSEVSDSINYAERIQKSILPSYTTLNEAISGLFVFFKPKSKVSGDFYWWTNIENHTVITAADCTGHGVPGAFMSMLGISYLREIVMKEYITHPGVILRKLRKEVIKSLKQTGELGEQKDGMDLGLLSINHENNLVQFAGANNPVYIVTSQKFFENNADLKDNCMIKVFEDCNPDNEANSKILVEIKPDKMPIGIYQKMDNFTMHEFFLQKGDTMYLFSDGFADQFGGPEGKKFKYTSFKNILLKNAHKPMFEQKEILRSTFTEWLGTYEQIDDIVVLGVQL